MKLPRLRRRMPEREPGQPVLITIKKRCPECKTASTMVLREGQPWVCPYCVAALL